MRSLLRRFWMHLGRNGEGLTNGSVQRVQQNPGFLSETFEDAVISKLLVGQVKTAGRLEMKDEIQDKPSMKQTLKLSLFCDRFKKTEQRAEMF